MLLSAASARRGFPLLSRGGCVRLSFCSCSRPELGRAIVWLFYLSLLFFSLFLLTSVFVSRSCASNPRDATCPTTASAEHDHPHTRTLSHKAKVMTTGGTRTKILSFRFSCSFWSTYALFRKSLSSQFAIATVPETTF